MADFNRDRLRELLDRRGVTPRALSLAIGGNPYIVRDILNGKSANPRSDTIAKMAAELGVALDELLPGAELHMGNTPDLPETDPSSDYVAVEVLPTFAGMGGGGTGDGDLETALVSRRLVADELRARPVDLLLINVRGNSMEPLFRHGDQLLVDRRDRSPTQPGPFALLYEDGYVVKNVEWIERRTLLRVSSANHEFAPETLAPDEITILGRPVWFARRL
jgi:phage repressor protein C with HTH and peptisase S24 domain